MGALDISLGILLGAAIGGLIISLGIVIYDAIWRRGK
jgi:hypothetical protein